MKTRIFTLVFWMALFGSYAFGQDCTTATPPVVGNVCTFNSSGNFTVPAGYSVTVSVQVWGGGGGGGDDIAGGTSSAPGGGGGGYSTGTFTISGTTLVTVGAGGVPDNTVANGHNGGASSFGGLVSAGGGLGPTTSGNNAAGASGGTGTIPGGTGGNSNSNGKTGGGGGGSGTGASNGQPGSTGPNPLGGIGGTPGGGSGGAENFSGNNGTAPGGGGGGRGASGATSGAGAPGQVIVTVTAVFPVELLSFTGKATPSAVQLNWETSTELNNEKFVVERSNDGRTFQMIGEELGQGTTQQTVSYEFMDKAPVVGINYYRLKQMDYDGQFAYSPVTAITFTRKGGISIYPTATNDMVNIVTEDEGNALVKVFHINGSLMKQQRFDGNTLPLDLSSLPNGTYLIAVETSTQIHQERIFKY
ncbi:T9SS type A sorting domain-containing protein [Lewinella sp. LCG006]|uniref:glycine-rich domain-containing protein n=1 Tax=Lewinella sp. LCG006 TaxID=3231911 RepID=UPI003460969B